MLWIKANYQAENADQARVWLDEFEAELGKTLPADRGGLAFRSIIEFEKRASVK